jgi:ubiquinone/menaquinone biosynthesis C-methylase UbiE
VNDAIVRDWVATINGGNGQKIGSLLDVATGAGTMLKLLLKYLPDQHPRIICLDEDGDALTRVKSEVAPQFPDATFLRSSVEELELPAESVQVAVWGNGIHYLRTEGQERALLGIRNALTKGGWLLFNTAFYAESRPPETRSFYRGQIRSALRQLSALGIRRETREARPPASEYQSISHYEQLLARTGFELQAKKQVAVRIYQTAMEQISGFYQYAAGALHGYRAETAADALREAVGPNIEKHGQRDEHDRPYILRNWLAIAARLKPV